MWKDTGIVGQLEQARIAGVSKAAATTDGDNNVTTADVTGSGAAPGGTNKAILVDVGGTNYWIALYAVS